MFSSKATEFWSNLLLCNSLNALRGKKQSSLKDYKIIQFQISSKILYMFSDNKNITKCE